MGKLIYLMITSLDGYVSDRDGNFGWGAPDEETHRFINDRMRSVGTYLHGRRMYEVMSYWETAHTVPDQPPFALDYAQIWRAADKVVYSTTLRSVSTERTRVERTFDPEAVRKLKTESELDLTVDGPNLAGHAVRAGLVDEYQLVVTPVVVGGGQPFFPADARASLELLDERRFGNGVVYLRYGVKDSS
ncbi:Dihydrofolate reductase [Micromonospora citrea]|uniref:Dihydrofolate reductase n=1 Tax=Micromonospora citrea TaxID=47855 RepID=A0A1C6TSW2_9ACTN|nr:dihydrofolate reductase family protein [Micromonospora citrea]SCL44711.1 Dihydrofolate reductase [Micromonospora citrea]